MPLPLGEPGLLLAAMCSKPPTSQAGCVAMRCLIIDDSPVFLREARALLEEEGIVVVGVASTAGEGLRRAIELRPDVTLVDICLGVSSGLDLVRGLARDSDAAGCLILISSHAEDEFADLIEASPAAGFVPKAALSAAAIRALVPGKPDGRGT